MKKICIALLASSLLAGAATAAPISAIDLTNSSGNHFNYSNTLGWAFVATSNLNVTSLGQWDRQDDGLETTSTVGIWDSAFTLLATGTVGAGTQGVLKGHYRYVDIADITLTAGNTYYVGSAFGGAVMRTDYAGYSFTPATGIDFKGGAFSSGGFAPTRTYTTYADLVGVAYGGANFEFGSAVPEPGSLALLGLGMLGFAAARRRKA